MSDYPSNGFRTWTEAGRVYLQINGTEYDLSVEEALAISRLLQDAAMEARWEAAGISSEMRAARRLMGDDPSARLGLGDDR